MNKSGPVENPDQIAEDLRKEILSAFKTISIDAEKSKMKLISLLEKILDRAPNSVLLDCAKSVSSTEQQVLADDLKESQRLNLVFEVGAKILEFRDKGVPPVLVHLVLSEKYSKVDSQYIVSQIAMAYKLP